jgi:uncharacterized protein YqjF (DUF2071 family)
MPTFLTAEWRHLLMLNYIIDPNLLLPYLPHGVELDQWNNKTYISIVGFLFLKTKVCGLPIPQHTDFEELNLRFYVKRKTPEGSRRGVVFIKEFVPRSLIALVARKCYNEPYLALPMSHTINLENGKLQNDSSVKYSWKNKNDWNFIQATAIGTPELAVEGSEEQFITEHYWGYTAQPNGTTKEYRVNHNSWKIWKTENPILSCDIAANYGPTFLSALTIPPNSTFIAEGSPITVSTGTRL